MTWCAVEPPFKESAGWFAPLLDLEVAESVLMEGAQEASEDYERFSAQRPVLWFNENGHIEQSDKIMQGGVR